MRLPASSGSAGEEPRQLDDVGVVAGAELEHADVAEDALGPAGGHVRDAARLRLLGDLVDLVDAERAADEEVAVLDEPRRRRRRAADRVLVVLQVERDHAPVDAAALVDPLQVGLDAGDRVLGEGDRRAADGERGVHAVADLAVGQAGAVALDRRRRRRPGAWLSRRGARPAGSGWPGGGIDGDGLAGGGIDGLPGGAQRLAGGGIDGNAT